MLLRGLVSTHLLAVNGNLDNREELDHAIDPQGELTKDEVKEIANRINILVQGKDLRNKRIHAKGRKSHKDVEAKEPYIHEPIIVEVIRQVEPIGHGLAFRSRVFWVSSTNTDHDDIAN